MGTSKETAMDPVSPHIIVVAAQSALRFTLEELLSAYGYTVTSVRSSEEVEDLVDQGQFAALLIPTPLPQTDRYGHALP